MMVCTMYIIDFELRKWQWGTLFIQFTIIAVLTYTNTTAYKTTSEKHFSFMGGNSFEIIQIFMLIFIDDSALPTNLIL